MQLIRSCWRRWVRDPGVSHDATSHATSPTTSHATSGARDDAQLRKPGEPVAVRAAERGWRTPVDDGDAYPRSVGLVLWAACELAIIACDLAEVIGTAIALKLLFGLPLVVGALIAALDVFLLLLLMGRGFRFIEAAIITLLAVIAACFA